MMKTKELVLAGGAVLLIMVSGIKAGTQYQFVDLGTLGGNWSASYGINDLGQIVGGSGADLGLNRATLFDATGSGDNIDLGTTEEVRGSSIAMGINNLGQIVGYGGYNNAAAFFDLENPYGNLNLGTLGGDASRAYGVNDLGQIVGEAQLPSGNWHAALFDSSGGGDNIGLGTLGGDQSEGRAINKNGQIVGSAELATGHSATLFDPSGTDTIKSLDLALASHANSINNSGRIVGQSYAYATLFDQSDPSNNIHLGGAHSEAHAINDENQIVGYTTSVLGERHATLFDFRGEGENIDLNEHVAGKPAGWILSEARDINNNGWIVGEGQNPEGQRRAFLLKPKPVRSPRFYAVIVGSESGGVRGDKDALAIYDSLLKHPGVQARNLWVLINPRSADNVRVILNKVIEEIQEEDQFLFYYSGHGTYGLDSSEPEITNSPEVYRETGYHTNSGDEYLAFNSPQDYISDDLLTEWLSSGSKMSKVRKLIILDSCMSGGFWGLENNEEDKGDLDKIQNIGLIAASSETDFAYAYPKFIPWIGGRGIFSLELEKGLSLGSDNVARADFNGDGDVSFAELSKFLDESYDSAEGEVGIIKGFPWLEGDIEAEIGSLEISVNYGAGFNPDMPVVPEPTATMLIWAASFLLVFHRREKN